ncbi:TonB-dependent receptor [Deminuibacter soli]|uniref:TonB-dependent receptor plug domain-containing protein n=1 Tax=Deminuibacter soli TaxID=2291815 RepID=A0A3E1NH65_9BACT|nr:TonB-dependent receptor plug domain-containing protein [Deminuibacter soli]RFM27275.1 hypothetical protein DXN05_14680 [Deminuibacter soli]
MNKRIGLLLLPAFLCTAAWLPGDPLPAITRVIDKFRKTYPQEKVYLHTDKPYYMAGDTLYFKGYVVNAEKNLPSAISNVLYADLIDEHQHISHTLRSPVTDGMATGSMALPDSLPPGNYRLRAYTAWMRNFSSDWFFDKTIPIGSSSNTQKATDKTSRPAVTQFFPEGGQMLEGLPARMAFKAVGSNGRSIAIKGQVTDETGTAVVPFSSGFGGMGSFVFTPQPGHVYTAGITYANGATAQVSLPQALKTGYMLAADNRDSAQVKLHIATAGVTAGQATLLGLCNNKPFFSTTISLLNGEASVNISRNKFPTGIAQFTLFTAEGIPVAERLVFVNHHDTLHVAAATDKKVYRPREPVTLTLTVTDIHASPVSGNFSLAVTDAGMVKPLQPEDASIVSSLLLTADIRGYIEQPGYYFTGDDTTRANDLDNLLLTQGWRRFSWTALQANQFPPIAFPAEKGLALRGKIISATGKPLPGARITLLPQQGDGYMMDTVTGTAGEFVFDDVQFTDQSSYVLQTPLATNSRATIQLNEWLAPAVLPAAWHNNSHEQALQHYITLNQPVLAAHRKQQQDAGRELEEVVVRSKRQSRVQEAVAPSLNLNGPGQADQVLTYEDLKNCHNLASCLEGRITGVRFKFIEDKSIRPSRVVALQPFMASGFNEQPMTVLLDGVEMTAATGLDMRSFNAADVQSIEVLRSGRYLAAYGTKGGNGLLIITTKKGGIDYDKVNDQSAQTNKLPEGVLFVKAMGYSAVREFYIPDYAVDGGKDIRSTIYWKPVIRTGENGTATIQFRNADNTGVHQIIIEGLSDNGKPAKQVVTYEVQ